MTLQEQYHELAFYTLAHPGGAFIHQHIVDVYTAQTANAVTQPISIVFALAGLYLCVEKNFTGKQVQQTHMQMAKHKNAWPAIVLPENRGYITIAHVLAIPPGAARDDMIRHWCASVWEAYKNNRETIINITEHVLNN